MFRLEQGNDDAYNVMLSTDMNALCGAATGGVRASGGLRRVTLGSVLTGGPSRQATDVI